MAYRETLSPEAQARLDADVVSLQEQLLEHTKQEEVRTSANRLVLQASKALIHESFLLRSRVASIAKLRVMIKQRREACLEWK